MDSLVIGVLALQGAFSKHAEVLSPLGVKVLEVRKEADLAGCDALIIPGGESTVIMYHIEFLGMKEGLQKFAGGKPVFGTCAGLIVMSRKIIGGSMTPFGWMDVDVERNAFGRQVESFRTEIDLQPQLGHSKSVPAVFIRAPRIRSYGKDVEVLAKYEEEPVLVRQGHHLGATFHPELSGETAIHLYFLELVRRSKTNH